MSLNRCSECVCVCVCMEVPTCSLIGLKCSWRCLQAEICGNCAPAQLATATGVVHLATTWFICNAYETDLVSCLAAHHTLFPFGNASNFQSKTDRQTLAQSRSVNLLNYKHGHFIRQRDKAESSVESVQIQINSVHYVWRLHLQANLFAQAGCLFSLKLSCPHHGHSIFFEQEVIEISKVNVICS